MSRDVGDEAEADEVTMTWPSGDSGEAESPTEVRAVNPDGEIADDGCDEDSADNARLYACVARLRDHLAAIRPAMERLRRSIPMGGRTESWYRDAVELASADVARSLTMARRSVRAIVAELSALETECRNLAADADRCKRSGKGTR
jgi:hypothetical protein